MRRPIIAAHRTAFNTGRRSSRGLRSSCRSSQTVLHADKGTMNGLSLRLVALLLVLCAVGAWGADFEREGIASWYGGKFHGRLTANGERFDANKLTAAHKTLPFGTVVKVTNTD